MKKLIVIGLIMICGLNVYSQVDYKDTTVYSFCEIMPEFRGEEMQLMNFISSNLKSPNNNSFVTMIIFNFVIEKDGSISNKQIIINDNNMIAKSENEILSECKQAWIDSSMLILNKMPKWKAGMQNGKFVRVKYHIIINLDPQPDLWNDK